MRSSTSACPRHGSTSRRRRSTSPALRSRTRATSRSRRRRETCASTATCVPQTSSGTRTTTAPRSSAGGSTTSTLTATRRGLTWTICRNSCGAGSTTGQADQAKRRRRMAIERNARATWTGDLKGGQGEFDLESSHAVEHEQVTFASRFEQPGGKTSPEELIAAAHATCFSMALSGGLARAGHSPTKLETDAQVTLDSVDGGFGITAIHLTVRGQVDGLDEAGFEQAAKDAKENCPVSKALAAVPKITLDASLA